MKLDEYNKKRDFNKTLEPSGVEKGEDSDKLIFLVQKHNASHLHYDFRLEWEGVLLSFAIPKGPSYNTKDKRLAVEVEPHPYDYKDFEGTIPKGEYGGGTVMLWDEGFWYPQEEYDFNKGLEDGTIKIILEGKRLKGKWALVRMKSKDNGKNNWLIIKEKDEFANSDFNIDDFNTSIRTGRTFEEIEKGDEPKVYAPMLSTQIEKIPKSDNYIYELKYDGYRIMAYGEKGTVKLLSRNGIDYTEKFPDIAKDLSNSEKDFIIDGEVVVNKNGKSDFQALQEYIKTKKGTKPIYMAFDLLKLGKKEFVKMPLQDRRDNLEKFLKESDFKYTHFSSSIEDNPEELFKTLCEKGMEGIMGKKKDSSYIEGRSKDWVKIKCDNTDEFIVVGFTKTDKATRAFSSLLLAEFEGDELIYKGRVGTGFSDESASEIFKKLKNITRKTSPLKEDIDKRSGETLIWVTPKLVAEVKYTEMTNDGLLRQASFKGLRDDKNTEEIKSEVEDNKPKEKFKSKNSSMKNNKNKSSNSEIILTNPDKKLIGDITKLDIYNYYEIIYKKMAPYIDNRLLTLVRCPSGIDKDCFYQKHPDDNNKYFIEKDIKEKDGKIGTYFYIDEKNGILEAVQLGTTEFHIWGSHVDKLLKPDIMVFDLDPDEGLDLENVREGVFDLKSILDDLDLKSFIKTSGNKGYHIVVPLKPKGDYDFVVDFSKNVAKVMERKWPKKYTTNMSKDKREDKIFIDYLRNRKSSTFVAPYSIRSYENAPISYPISYDNVKKIAPNDITMEIALKDNSKDPWDGFFEITQSIG